MRHGRLSGAGLYNLIMIIMLQFLDFATTIKAVGNGAIELNPLSRFLLEDLGPLFYIFIKITVGIALWYFYYNDIRVMLLVWAIYLQAIINNIRNMGWIC